MGYDRMSGPELYDRERGPWWLVRYLDSDGLCRAWAAGDPNGKAGVRSEATHQLQTYRAKKDALGDPLGQASYTLAEELVPTDASGPRRGAGHITG
jgi:hypothetical protein